MSSTMGASGVMYGVKTVRKKWQKIRFVSYDDKC